MPVLTAGGVVKAKVAACRLALWYPTRGFEDADRRQHNDQSTLLLGQGLPLAIKLEQRYRNSGLQWQCGHDGRFRNTGRARNFSRRRR